MFHTRRKNFSALSDFKTNWDNEKKECILHLTIPGSTMTIELPCVEAYKYLGIKINRSLTIKDHLLYIKRKADYITNSLIAQFMEHFYPSTFGLLSDLSPLLYSK